MNNKTSEQTYETRVHLIFSTKDRKRVFRNAAVKDAFLKQLYETAKEEHCTILDVQFGVENQLGETVFQYAIVHIKLETHGTAAPDKLLNIFKKEGWRAMRDTDPDLPAGSSFTKDYYISDDTMYDPAKAYEFAVRRSWKTRNAGVGE